MLQSLIASSQFGHGKGCGDANGRHEYVGVARLVLGQLLVEGEGEESVGLGQLPDPRVGGLWDLLRLSGQDGGLVFGVGVAVDAVRL